MDYRLSYRHQEEIKSIKLPGSKSITNRVLIVNALCANSSNINGEAQCDDTDAITEALNRCYSEHIDIGACGTAMRFLTAYFATSTKSALTLTGSQRMLCRPIKPLVDSLNLLGADITYLNENGFPPLLIKGKRLKGREIEVRGDISSQFISALMMIGPTLQNGLTIHLLGDIVSRPYIDMTSKVMQRFGIDISIIANTIKIPEQSYLAPPAFSIEADWSSASYFYELVALSDQNIKLMGLSSPQTSLQGDSHLSDLFSYFGVNTSFCDGFIEVSSRPDFTCDDRPLNLNLSATPDLVPAMVVTACLKNIRFNFFGIHNLRVKECDRIVALTTEMRRLGYSLHYDSDSIAWLGEKCQADESPMIQTYSDHRMAMAFAPAAILHPDLRIADAMVVNKSFPGFWNEMSSVGITTTPI